MNYSDLIAVRYMRSRQNRGFVSFISGIAILGVMLGTATLIIALSILGGFEREITEKVVCFTSHIQVLSFRNVPLRNYDDNATRIERAFPIVRSVSPFVAREALLRSSAGVEGLLLKGVEPLRDNSTTRRNIIEGDYNLDRQQGGTWRRADLWAAWLTSGKERIIVPSKHAAMSFAKAKSRPITSGPGAFSGPISAAGTPLRARISVIAGARSRT